MIAFTITLASARVNAGLTQIGLAQKLNVHVSTIKNWEKGKTSPDFKQVKAISEITGIPPDYIFLPDALLKVNVRKHNAS